MTLALAARMMQVLAAIFALALARRRADHRPVAAFLIAVSLAGFLRAALLRWLIEPFQAAHLGAALTGLPLAAFHVEVSLFLLWPAGLAALTLAVFPQRRPWPVAILWLLAAIVIAAAYPLTRGDVLRRCYLAAELLGLLGSFGTFLVWLRTHEPITFPRFLVMNIVGLDSLILLGPYLGNPFTMWGRAQAIYLVLYGLLALFQGGALWTLPSTSRPR